MAKYGQAKFTAQFSDNTTRIYTLSPFAISDSDYNNRYQIIKDAAIDSANDSGFGGLLRQTIVGNNPSATFQKFSAASLVTVEDTVIGSSSAFREETDKLRASASASYDTAQCIGSTGLGGTEYTFEIPYISKNATLAQVRTLGIAAMRMLGLIPQDVYRVTVTDTDEG